MDDTIGLATNKFSILISFGTFLVFGQLACVLQSLLNNLALVGCKIAFPINNSRQGGRWANKLIETRNAYVKKSDRRDAENYSDQHEILPVARKKNFGAQ